MYNLMRTTTPVPIDGKWRQDPPPFSSFCFFSTGTNFFYIYKKSYKRAFFMTNHRGGPPTPLIPPVQGRKDGILDGRAPPFSPPPPGFFYKELHLRQPFSCTFLLFSQWLGREVVAKNLSGSPPSPSWARMGSMG